MTSRSPNFKVLIFHRYCRESVGWTSFRTLAEARDWMDAVEAQHPLLSFIVQSLQRLSPEEEESLKK